MKKLENKILNTIYVLETKRTAFEIILRTVSIVTLLGICIFIVADIINVLIKQQTLDVLQLFQEDREVIQSNLREVLSTLYIELPLFEIVLTLVLLTITIVIVVLFVKNYARIKRKISVLKKYWFKH